MDWIVISLGLILTFGVIFLVSFLLSTSILKQLEKEMSKITKKIETVNILENSKEFNINTTLNKLYQSQNNLTSNIAENILHLDISISKTLQNIEKAVAREVVHDTPSLAITKDLLKQALSDNTLRGVWGEVNLEMLLQAASLVKDRHYQMQYSTKNDKGEVVRPDCVLFAPNDLMVIVDSKFPSPSGDVICAIEKHVVALSKKRYDTISGALVVIMFIPLEYNIPVDLLIKAYQYQIAIATPATLLAMIKVLSKVCPIEQKADEQQLARLNLELYERGVGLMKAVSIVEKDVNKTLDQLHRLKWHVDQRIGVTARKIQKLANYELDIPDMGFNIQE